MKTTTQQRILDNTRQGLLTFIGKYAYSVQYDCMMNRTRIIRALYTDLDNWEWLEPLSKEVK